jgi:hypothetical protein
LITDLAVNVVFLGMGVVSVFLLVAAFIPVDHRRLPPFLHDRWIWLDRSPTDTMPRIAIPNEHYGRADLWAWRTGWAFFLVLSQSAAIRGATWEMSPATVLVGAAEALLLMGWTWHVFRCFLGARPN